MNENDDIVEEGLDDDWIFTDEQLASLKQSLEEVMMIRAGKMKPLSMDDLGDD